MIPALTLGEIAEHLGAKIVVGGQASSQVARSHELTNIVITGLGALATAQAGHLSHLSSPAYKPLLADCRASAVILQAQDLSACPCIALVVEQPYLAFAQASGLFVQPLTIPPGVHATAVVHESATVAATARLGAHVVVGADVLIEADVTVHANVSISDRVRLQRGVEVMSNVSIYADSNIGPRSVVHSGAVIGSPGFGYTPNQAGHLQPIAQLGGVRIGADVRVGAGTTIDRGAIDDTIIEDGVKMDDQVHIGHNCHVGAHSIICGCAGMAGSTVIGRHCVIAGGVGIGGKNPITLCDGVTISVMTTITQSIDKPGTYSSGVVASEHGQWLRNALRFGALSDLFKRVKALELREKADVANQDNN